MNEISEMCKINEMSEIKGQNKQTNEYTSN